MTHAAPPLPTAADLMQCRLHTAAPDAPIEDAVRLLHERGYAAAPVVDDGGRLLGILSEHDAVRVLAEAIAEGWPTGRVRDHMTRELETVAPTTDLLALADRFIHGRHRRLLVVEDGRLVGLIARRDLVRGLAALEHARDHARDPQRKPTTYELMETRRRRTVD